MFASWIFLLVVAFSQSYKHCPDNVDGGIPKACFNSVSETKKLSNSLLPQDQYDLRVVTFNTYDWNAQRKGFERIKKWLKEVLPTVHVIAFQEFGHGGLDGFVRNFGLTPIKKKGKKDKMIYIRSNLIQEYSDEVTYTKRNGIGKDSCHCNKNWDRGVDIARIKVGNHQVYLANNHGCVGGCGGSATAYGGSAIIEVLKEQGFFTNEGAHSIFLGDVNYWHSKIYSNDPKGLCAPQIHGSLLGKMSVRGKLECGAGHPFDFVAYGRGFRAKKHYSFSGGGKNYNGDSDHKAVMLDLVFTDNYKPSGDNIQPSRDNIQPSVNNRIVVNFVGKDNCASSPCSDGESDCDNDNECKGDLICWQRSNGETDPRYDTSGIDGRADVCVQPKNSVSEDSKPDTSTSKDSTPDNTASKDSTPENSASKDSTPDSAKQNNDPVDTKKIGQLTDEFSGSAVDESKWEIMHFDAHWKNHEKQCYVPSNVKVENGNLILTATKKLSHDSKCGGQQYFSGSIESKTYILYGTIEVRAKLPSGDGLWPAIWLLGKTHKNKWPACGEIDLMEVANKDPMGSIGTLHYGPPKGNSKNLPFGRTPKVPLKEDFHTWKIIRTPDIIVMFFDGVEFGRKTKSQVLATNYPHSSTMFDAEMRVIFNVAVGGGFTGINNREPKMDTWDKDTMEIDYIRTSDDQTVPGASPGSPGASPGSCMDTTVCDSGTCASCQSRVEWLKSNRGKTTNEATQQVASEFPDKCNCDSHDQNVPGKKNDPVDTKKQNNDPVDTKSAFKVMSYNTEYKGYSDGRVPSYGKQIQKVGAAVVGTQECQDKNGLERAASPYKVVPNTDFQNPIYYNPGLVSFEGKSGWEKITRDKYAERTFTYAKFKWKATGQDFWFFNTHLPHNHGDASDPYTHSKIARQLLDKRKELGAGDKPTVVVCDCNSFASNGAKKSFRSVLKEGGIPQAYVATGKKGGHPNLDRIFMSKDHFEQEKGYDSGLGKSDHTSIAVEAKFKGKSQASFVEVAVAAKSFNARIIALGGIFTLVAFLFLRSRKHAQEKGVYHALMDASEEEI